MLDLRKIGACAAAALAAWAPAPLVWAQESGADAAATGDELNALVEVTAAQMQILNGLGLLAGLMIVVFALLIFSLQSGARELADTNDAKARYYALPFGVPEGTIRGIVSILIIVLGIAVLVVQGPLGIESSEAIASFVGAVIAFYFVTREQAQTRGAIEQSAEALRNATRSMRVASARLRAPGEAEPFIELAEYEAEDAVKRSAKIAPPRSKPAGPLSEQRVRSEISAYYQPLVTVAPAKYEPSVKVKDTPYHLLGIHAKILRVDQDLQGSAYLRPYRNLILIDADGIAPKAMTGTLGDLEKLIIDDVIGDLKTGGVTLLP